MAKITPTSTIALDDVTFEVDRMSDNVKQMVSLFDDWRQREADLTSDLLMVRAALKDLQNTLFTTITEERQSAAKAAAALGLLPDVDSTAPVAPAAKDGEGA